MVKSHRKGTERSHAIADACLVLLVAARGFWRRCKCILGCWKSRDWIGAFLGRKWAGKRLDTVTLGSTAHKWMNWVCYRRLEKSADLWPIPPGRCSIRSKIERKQCYRNLFIYFQYFYCSMFFPIPSPIVDLFQHNWLLHSKVRSFVFCLVFAKFLGKT